MDPSGEFPLEKKGKNPRMKIITIVVISIIPVLSLPIDSHGINASSLDTINFAFAGKPQLPDSPKIVLADTVVAAPYSNNIMNISRKIVFKMGRLILV